MKHYKFTDVPFMSAKEKLSVLKAWVTFLKYGCRGRTFTPKLYDHLNQHCSFIAHFNRAGFYNVYFSTAAGTRKFLSQFDKRGPCMSAEYGGHWGMPEYRDLQMAMIEEASPFIPNIVTESWDSQRLADVQQARLLLSLHGLTAVITDTNGEVVE